MVVHVETGGARVIEVKTKSTDGISIDFQVHGKGMPALVFVHGWCCNQSYWAPQVDYFSKRYTVVTLDIAGHGESELGRDSWTMEAFGKDVEAVIRVLNLDQTVLIGHSMGGHVIVEAARRLPGRVIGLVAADAFHDVESRVSPEEFDERYSRFYDDFIESTRDLVTTLFGPTANPDLVERVAADMAAAPLEVGLGAAKEAQQGHDLARALEDVQVPIRCINSDWITTNLEALRRHTSSCDIVYMSKVGHFVMMEDPDVFNRHLSDIVNEFVSHKV